MDLFISRTEHSLLILQTLYGMVWYSSRIYSGSCTVLLCPLRSICCRYDMSCHIYADHGTQLYLAGNYPCFEVDVGLSE